jgi:hypothetical protein
VQNLRSPHATVEASYLLEEIRGLCGDERQPNEIEGDMPSWPVRTVDTPVYVGGIAPLFEEDAHAGQNHHGSDNSYR